MLTFFKFIYSQNVFEKIFPVNINNEFSYISELLLLPDTDYIISTTAYNNGNNSILIGKFSNIGEIEWLRQLDDSYPNNQISQASAALSPDFNLYMTCSVFDTISLKYCSIVLKMDTSGNLIWCKKYCQNNRSDYSENIFITSNYIYLAGECYTIYNSDIYLTKLDINGNFLWQKTYNSGITNYLRSSMMLQNGDIMLCGLTKDSLYQEYASFLRINSDGNIIWNKRFHLPSYKEFNAQVVNEDSTGNIIISGHVDSVSSTIGFGLWDIFLMKLSSSGIFQWAKIYGEDNFDEAWSVIPTKDNGFMLGAEPESFGGVSRISLLKTDSIGNIEWMRLYGKSTGGFPNNIILNPDNGFTIFASDGGFNVIAPMILIRTDSLGLTICNEPLVTVQQNSFIPIEDSILSTDVVTVTIPSYNPIFLNYPLKAYDYCDITQIPLNKKEIENIKIFPNPFQSTFYISIKKNDFKKLKITLRNILGQSCYENDLYISKNENFFTVDMSTISNGIYFIELSTDNEKIVKKIIKSD